MPRQKDAVVLGRAGLLPGCNHREQHAGGEENPNHHSHVRLLLVPVEGSFCTQSCWKSDFWPVKPSTRPSWHRTSFENDLAVGAASLKHLPPNGPLALRRNVILASIWAGRNCSAGIAERLHHLAILRPACNAVGDRELARFLLCSAREGPAQCLIVSPGPRPPSIRWSPPGITSPMRRQKNAVVLGGTSFLRKRQHWQQQGCGNQNSIRRSHTSLVDVMPAF